MKGDEGLDQISVIIADDQSLVREGLRILLQHQSDIAVIGQARDGAEAVELARSLRPQVVLMDIRMPRVDGIEATQLIVDDPELNRVRVLVLTTFEDEEVVGAGLRAGATGFIGKGSKPADLIHAIRTVHAGDSLLSSAVTRALIERYVLGRRDTTDPPEELASLTSRELDILTHVARGRTNEQIAAELGISYWTVKTHVKRTMTKLDAHDRAQLIVLAFSSGIVP
jgi:DNA-binding NarL/FixJ family response regulator